jgi:hypothetical protein
MMDDGAEQQASNFRLAGGWIQFVRELLSGEY